MAAQNIPPEHSSLMPPKTTAAQEAARRAQIVAGARRCFARHGYHGTTVEDLERSCRLTRATLFRYFASKAEMLEAVVAAEEEKLEQGFAAALGSGRRSLGELIGGALALQVARSAADPDALPLRLELLALGRRDRRLGRRVAAMEQAQRQWRKALVAAALSSGEVHPGWSADAVTDAISTVALGLATQVSFGFPLAEPAAAQVPALAAALSGLLAGPPPASPSPPPAG